MRLLQSFDVAAPVDRVWDALVDVQRVAPCLPGAKISETDESGAYRGSFTVKLGPTTASYRGELRLEQADSGAHEATMRAKGQDKRGQGAANATIVSRLRDEGEVTRVEVETDFTITGRLARFGRSGMIEDVSNRLLRDFAQCLQHSFEAPAQAEATDALTPEGAPPPAPAAQPVKGLSLFFSALWGRVRWLFRRRRGSSR